MREIKRGRGMRVEEEEEEVDGDVVEEREKGCRGRWWGENGKKAWREFGAWGE